MGKEIYDYYYQFLYNARTDPLNDETKMRAQLNEMTGQNKELKNLIFDLEQIVFRDV